MINCRNCKYRESDYNPHCTKFKIFLDLNNDGCTFGAKKTTNEEKFEIIEFGVSLHLPLR